MPVTGIERRLIKDSRVDLEDHPAVGCQAWLPAIRDFKNKVNGFGGLGRRGIELENRGLVPFPFQIPVMNGKRKRPCLPVGIPMKGELIPVRVGGCPGIKGDGRSRGGLDEDGFPAEIAIYFNEGRVIGPLEVRVVAPVEAGRKVVLVSFPPAPDRGMITRVPLSVYPFDLVHGVGPYWAGLGFVIVTLGGGGVEFVTTSPSSPVGMLRLV